MRLLSDESVSVTERMMRSLNLPRLGSESIAPQPTSRATASLDGYPLAHFSGQEFLREPKSVQCALVRGLLFFQSGVSAISLRLQLSRVPVEKSGVGHFAQNRELRFCQVARLMITLWQQSPLKTRGPQTGQGSRPFNGFMRPGYGGLAIILSANFVLASAA